MKDDKGLEIERIVTDSVTLKRLIQEVIFI